MRKGKILFPLTQYKNQKWFRISYVGVMVGAFCMFISSGSNSELFFLFGLVTIAVALLILSILYFLKNYRIVGEIHIDTRRVTVVSNTKIDLDWEKISQLTIHYHGFDGEFQNSIFRPRKKVQPGYKNKIFISTEKQDYTLTFYLENLKQKRVFIRFINNLKQDALPVFLHLSSGGEE